MSRFEKGQSEFGIQKPFSNPVEILRGYSECNISSRSSWSQPETSTVSTRALQRYFRSLLASLPPQPPPKKKKQNFYFSKWSKAPQLLSLFIALVRGLAQKCEVCLSGPTAHLQKLCDNSSDPQGSEQRLARGFCCKSVIYSWGKFCVLWLPACTTERCFPCVIGVSSATFAVSSPYTPARRIRSTSRPVDKMELELLGKKKCNTVK